MGVYTVSDEADKKIQSDMDFVVSEIRKRDPEVISIILTGGFSRGEGPVKIDGKKILPYNDYDIQIVSKKKFSKENADKISVEISKELGYRGIENFYPFKKEEQRIDNNFYIDLKWDTINDLKGLLPRIRNYELRNDSKVIYGKDVRKVIPNFSLKDMPLSEGAKLLLDRMSQLIEYYSSENNYEQECLSYFIQQAYVAACTSLLLLSGKYKIGYKTSMEILLDTYEQDFPELFREIPDLHHKIRDYVNWKIEPKKPTIKNVKEEWFIVKENMLKVSKYFFSKFLDRRINNVGDLSNSILGMGEKFYLPYINDIVRSKIGFSFDIVSRSLVPFVKLILIRKYKERLMEIESRKKDIGFKSPDLIIFGALPFIVDSIKRDGIDRVSLWRGKRILNEIYPMKGVTWEQITVEYANAYIVFFLQKL